MKIFLKEDEKRICDILNMLLEREGLHATYVHENDHPTHLPHSLSVGNTILNLDCYLLVCGGHRLHLPAKEFAVILLLVSRQGSVVSKKQIALEIWGPESEISDNLVEVYMANLRKKLRSIGSNLRIQTLRNLGYVIE